MADLLLDLCRVFLEGNLYFLGVALAKREGRIEKNKTKQLIGWSIELSFALFPQVA